MKRKLIITTLPVLLLGIIGIFHYRGLVNAQPSLTGDQVSSEYWTLGITSEGSSAYEAAAGRMVTNVAALRADHGVSDVYFIFPAAAGSKSVSQGRFLILSRSGELSGEASMTLEIHDMSGSLVSTVSQPVNLLDAGVDEWTQFALSGVPEDRVLLPGEVLVAHFAFTDNDSLQMFNIFEIELGSQ